MHYGCRLRAGGRCRDGVCDAVGGGTTQACTSPAQYDCRNPAYCDYPMISGNDQCGEWQNIIFSTCQINCSCCPFGNDRVITSTYTETSEGRFCPNPNPFTNPIDTLSSSLAYIGEDGDGNEVAYYGKTCGRVECRNTCSATAPSNLNAGITGANSQIPFMFDSTPDPNPPANHPCVRSQRIT